METFAVFDGCTGEKGVHLYCPQDREANHARTHYILEPEDRNGRHWMRVELGTILMKFAFEITVQLWSPL